MSTPLCVGIMAYNLALMALAVAYWREHPQLLVALVMSLIALTCCAALIGRNSR